MARHQVRIFAGFDSQLASTAMFFEPAKAVEFTNGAELPKTRISRNFLFSHGILGTNARTSTRSACVSPMARRWARQECQCGFDPAYMAQAAPDLLTQADNASQRNRHHAARGGAEVARPPQRRPKVRSPDQRGRVSRGGPCSLAACRFCLWRSPISLSAQRLAVNPSDKLLPSPAQMWSAFFDLATVPTAFRRPDPVRDTYASLVRLFAGVGVATLSALPRCRHRLHPAAGLSAAFVTVVCVIPPLAPTADPVYCARPRRTAKITLIAVGVAPVMLRRSPTG